MSSIFVIEFNGVALTGAKVTGVSLTGTKMTGVLFVHFVG